MVDFISISINLNVPSYIIIYQRTLSLRVYIERVYCLSKTEKGLYGYKNDKYCASPY